MGQPTTPYVKSRGGTGSLMPRPTCVPSPTARLSFRRAGDNGGTIAVSADESFAELVLVARSEYDSPCVSHLPCSGYSPNSRSRLGAVEFVLLFCVVRILYLAITHANSPPSNPLAHLLSSTLQRLLMPPIGQKGLGTNVRICDGCLRNSEV